MSSPILPSSAVTAAFTSVVVSLPEMGGGRGKAGIMASIDQLREETRASAEQLGFADGRAAGFDDGFAEGMRQGRKEAAEAAALEARQVGEALANEVGELHARMEEGWQAFLAAAEAQMTARCMETVRALLDTELQLGRESALNIVRRCLGEMVHATAIKVRVASEDLPYLQKYLDDERVQLVADGSIGAGCIVESSSGKVDGTLATSLVLLENAWEEAA